MRVPPVAATPFAFVLMMMLKAAGASYPSLGSIFTSFGYHSTAIGPTSFCAHSVRSGASVVSSVIL